MKPTDLCVLPCRSSTDEDAFNVFLGEGTWSSGETGRQCVQLKLSKPVSLTGARLTVSQSTEGYTCHLIEVSEDGEHWHIAREFEGHTSDHQILSATHLLAHTPPSFNTRYVRVTTTDSPSRVAWAGIQLSGIVRAHEQSGERKSVIECVSLACHRHVMVSLPSVVSDCCCCA